MTRVGDFRSGNSQQSSPFFSRNGDCFAQIPALDGYGGTQLADRYQKLWWSGRGELGDWGAVSVDVTHARSQLADDSTHQGQSLRFLYAKSLNNYGTTFHCWATAIPRADFYTLDDVAYRSSGRVRLSR